MNINYNELDTHVIPLVKYFNENGLPTIMSCQGHNKTNVSMFWIQFSKTVTENNILEFMKSHLDSHQNFTSNGRFAERVYCGYNANNEFYVHKSWNYFAATKEAALQDLKNWERDEYICL